MDKNIKINLEKYKDIIEMYYKDNAKKLYEIVDRILYKDYGGTLNRDIGEFYDVATDIFMEILVKDKFDLSKGDFNGYLYNSLRLGIIDDIKQQQRFKRCNKEYQLDKNGNKILDKNGKPLFIIISDERLDAPIGESAEQCVGDITAGKFDINREIREENQFSDKMLQYLNRLSSLQREVLRLTIAGYKPGEIKRKLHISEKQYSDCNTAIHSYRNVSVLF